MAVIWEYLTEWCRQGILKDSGLGACDGNSFGYNSVGGGGPIDLLDDVDLILNCVNGGVVQPDFPSGGSNSGMLASEPQSEASVGGGGSRLSGIVDTNLCL